eukprot:g11051.t1
MPCPLEVRQLFRCCAAFSGALNCGLSPRRLVAFARQRFEEQGGTVLEQASLQALEVYDDQVLLQLQGDLPPIPFPSANGGADGSDRTTYFFTYCLPGLEDLPSIPKVFEKYVEALPQYQGVSLEQLKVQRALCASFVAYRESPLQTPFDRILQVGDAAGIQSPLSFGGFGALCRHLPRLETAISEALEQDLLTAEDLSQINPYLPNLAMQWSMYRSIAQPPENEPEFVNRMMGGILSAAERCGTNVMMPILQEKRVHSKCFELVRNLVEIPKPSVNEIHVGSSVISAMSTQAETFYQAFLMSLDPIMGEVIPQVLEHRKRFDRQARGLKMYSPDFPAEALVEIDAAGEALSFQVLNLGAMDGRCSGGPSTDPANCLLLGHSELPALDREGQNRSRWGGILVEVDPPPQLFERFAGRDDLLVVPRPVFPENARHPESLDLLKIDLDSFDCDVISSVLRVGPLASNPPKLLYIDFNPHIPPPFLYRTISRSQSRIIPFQGSSLQCFLEAAPGFQLLHVELFNAILVRRDLQRIFPELRKPWGSDPFKQWAHGSLEGAESDQELEEVTYLEMQVDSAWQSAELLGLHLPKLLQLRLGSA